MGQVHLNGSSVPRYVILKVYLNELSKKERKILGHNKGSDKSLDQSLLGDSKRLVVRVTWATQELL